MNETKILTIMKNEKKTWTTHNVDYILDCEGSLNYEINKFPIKILYNLTSRF